jgi:hypothetical protein
MLGDGHTYEDKLATSINSNDFCEGIYATEGQDKEQ